MCRMRRMNRQYLKTRQVAKILGVSLNTLYRWLKAEKISEPNRDPVNNYRLWTADDVDRIRRQLVTEYE
jgi:DNA-binding transcriptional MerR regulator